MDFIQHERLHWDSVSPASTEPFANRDDYKILQNDWPYGIDPEVTHLVVWTKFDIEEDPDSGDLSDASRTMLEAFVVKTFCGDGSIPRDRLVWFKNWKALKSIHAIGASFPILPCSSDLIIEHFHVLLYRAPRGFIDRLTGGDKPMAEQLDV